MPPIIASLKKPVSIIMLFFAIMVTGIAFAPVAHAGTKGPETPSAYNSSLPLGCFFTDGSRVECFLYSDKDKPGVDGDISIALGSANVKDLPGPPKVTSRMAYWYSPEASAKAGHDVFIPTSGSSSAKWGWLHFPNSASGDYKLGQISTNQTDGSKGRINNLVQEGNASAISTSDNPVPKDTCSLYLAREGKAKTCKSGSGSGKVEKITVVSGGAAAEAALIERSGGGCDEGGIGFILCPIEKILTTVNEKIVGFIAGALIVQTDSFASSGSELRTVFNQVLLISNGLFALIFLVIIFGNTLSLGIDSYTIKKALPRLVMAVILAQFSYFIAGSVIEIGNVLCKGILLTLTGGGSLSLGNIGGTPDLFGTIGSILLELTFLLLAFVAVLVGIVVLALRQIILIGLIVAGPIAFAAWVLPGTEKIFKFWWSNLIKLSLMGPIIVGLLAGAFKLQEIVFHGPSGPIVQLGASLLPIIALLYLPKTFKWSGSLMSTTGGKIADWGSGQAKKQTVGRAKNAVVGEGGVKDKFFASEAGSKFGGLTGKSRLKKQAGALSNLEKVNSGYANAAKTQLSRSFNAIDATPGLSDDQKDQMKNEAFDNTMKTLGRDTKAKAAVVAQFAKSGNRDIVEHAARTNALGGDAGWQSMVSQNYDSFDGMADLRKSPGTNGVSIETNLGKTLSGSNADGVVKAGAATQQAFFGYQGEKKDAAGNVVQPEVAYNPMSMSNLSGATLQDLGADGVRSRLAPKARFALETYRSDIAAKVAAGTALTAKEQEHSNAFSNWK